MLRQLGGAIFLLIFTWESLTARELTREDIQGVLQKAGEQAETFTLPENDYKEEGKRAARQSAELYHSQAFQQKIEEEQKRIQKCFIPAPDETDAPMIMENKKEKTQEQSEEMGQEEIYVFLSSSVPLATVQNWIKLAAQTGSSNISFVMRGIPGGLKGRNSWLRDVVKKEPQCHSGKTSCDHYKVKIAIKPSLFRKYSVTEVPTLLYLQRDKGWIMAGGCPLNIMLERINREAESPLLITLIKKMRNGW